MGKIDNLEIIVSPRKGGSKIELVIKHLMVNAKQIPCRMGIFSWDSKVPKNIWIESFNKKDLPIFPFESPNNPPPKAALGEEYIYMDGFVFNPYHVFDNISFSHHSIWNVWRNGKVFASIEAGVIPVDGKDIIYVRRGEFLSVLTNDGKSVYTCYTNLSSTSFIEKLYKSGELN